MDLKKEIKSRGLKFVWVADQINVPRNSLTVYLNHPSLMPQHVEEKLKKFLK